MRGACAEGLTDGMETPTLKLGGGRFVPLAQFLALWQCEKTIFRNVTLQLGSVFAEL